MASAAITLCKTAVINGISSCDYYICCCIYKMLIKEWLRYLEKRNCKC